MVAEIFQKFYTFFQKNPSHFPGDYSEKYSYRCHLQITFLEMIKTNTAALPSHRCYISVLEKIEELRFGHIKASMQRLLISSNVMISMTRR